MPPAIEARLAALERHAGTKDSWGLGMPFLYAGVKGPSPEQAAQIQRERDASRPVFLIELIGLEEAAE